MALDENQANDDQAVGALIIGAVGGNASQTAKSDLIAGTAIKNSPNNAGDGTAQSNPNTAITDAPGRRLKNPLGALSSYTYQLSLYMITPDAYDAFNAGGMSKRVF